MKTFLHSGSLGDCIYSLPTIKALGGGILYIKERSIFAPYNDMYNNLKSLLEMQPYVHEVRLYPQTKLHEYDTSIRIDYDLDKCRIESKKGVKHIIKWHLDAFFLEVDNWRDKWLNIDAEYNGLTLIHLTDRWRDNSKVNWKYLLKNIKGDIAFIGHEKEYLSFVGLYGKIPYIQTENLCYFAKYIAGCKALYCNQSVSLAIAQGLGKEYYLERKPNKTNCLLYTNNEHIL